MFRAPPVPMTGFAAATSGVALANPNVLGTDGSTFPKLPPENGFAKCGWLRMLKNSARNWISNRSVIFVVFTSEKSQLSSRGPRKVLRPMVPNCPNSGGTITVPPSAKQPNAWSWLRDACARQLALLCCASEKLKKGIPPLGDALMFAASPKIFQRSLNSPVRLISFPFAKPSVRPHGVPPETVTREFTCQPSSNWPQPFREGRL